MQLVLTSELLLEAYRQGLFPMAYNADSPYIQWVCPEMRGQLSITELHIPKSLLKAVKKEPFEIRISSDFESVIRLCGEAAQDRPETWINQDIIVAYCKLHEEGFAHSVECWQDGTLVGGLYGLAMGGAFFGESMFSRATNASKIALIHLCARLWKGGFTLLDTQFVNDHLQQFGVTEIAHWDYKIKLDEALIENGDFILEEQTERSILQDYLTFRKEQSAL